MIVSSVSLSVIVLAKTGMLRANTLTSTKLLFNMIKYFFLLTSDMQAERIPVKDYE